MELLKKLLLLLLAAAFTENIILVRGFCLGEIDHRTLTFRSAATDSLWMLPLVLSAVFSGWMGSWLVLHVFPIHLYLRPPIYLAIYILLFFLVQLSFRHIEPWKRCGMKFLNTYTAVAFGFVPIGVLLIVGQGTFSILEALIFAVGTVAGYFLAAELLVSVRDALVLSRVPKSMQGLPVLLLSMGLISLALFVLLGHELAL